MNKSAVFQSKSLIHKFTYKDCSMHLYQISTIILPNKINQNLLISCNTQTVFSLYQLYGKNINVLMIVCYRIQTKSSCYIDWCLKSLSICISLPFLFSIYLLKKLGYTFCRISHILDLLILSLWSFNMFYPSHLLFPIN